LISTIHATIIFNGQWWIGLFERKDEANYAVAKHIFGQEPTDPEIYDFVLKSWQVLKFTEPLNTDELEIKVQRKNFKRVRREIRKLLEKLDHARPMTHAQEVLSQDLEKNKKTRKAQSAQEKQAEEKFKFSLKQAKRKQKHRGH